MKVKSESEVTQPCPTLNDPMDCSPPGSSIPGIFQARVLELGAIAFSVPSGAMVKNPPANAGIIRDMALIPRLRRFPGGEQGNPLQYFCLEKSHGQRSLMGYNL